MCIFFDFLIFLGVILYLALHRNRMKKIAFIFLFFLCACEPIIPLEKRQNMGNGHRGESGVLGENYLPPLSKDEEEKDSQHLYLCGVRYPEGYDWVKDEQKGSVEAYLFLLKDETLAYETPAGVAYDLATDSDMHRILRGRLYMDYSTETETIVRCEDEEIYRVQGREYMKGMLYYRNALLTLCQPRNHGGEWVLRSDGAPLLNGVGNVVGGLYYNNDTLSGSWYPPQEGDPVVFSVQNGSDFVLYSNFEMYTYHSFDASVKCYDGGLAGTSPWVMFESGDEAYFQNLSRPKTLSFPLTEKWVDLDGHPNFICLLTRSASGNAVLRKYSWSIYSNVEWVEWEDHPYALAVKGNQWCVLLESRDGTHYKIVSEEGETALPKGARPYSKNCFLFCEGKLYLSLIMNEKAALYVDGEIRTFPFNGYIDGIVVGE